MITSPIIHPPILQALASAGHRSTIMIADANFSAATNVGKNATVAYLNFTAGSTTTVEVIDALVKMIPIEKHTSMLAPPDLDTGVQSLISEALGGDVPHEIVEREELYSMARSDNLALCIVTGDTRRFANSILTVGVNIV